MIEKITEFVLKSKKLQIIIGCLFAFNFLGSVMFVFLYKRELFMELEVAKLVIFSFSITMPINLILSIATFADITLNKENTESEDDSIKVDVTVAIVTGSIMTGIIMYVVSLITMFCKIELRYLIVIILVIVLLASILLLYEAWLCRKRNNRNVITDQNNQPSR